MTITRRSALQILAAGSVAAQRRGPARKPNVIVILADDMGCGDLGCFGGKDVLTPHIDSLAAAGTKFTDGYVSCAVCSPSRAALLTGRYQQRFGHEFNSSQGGAKGAVFGLPKTERTLAQYLKPQGYRTAAIGKWHLGDQEGYFPQDHGFDEYFGFLEGADEYVIPGMKDARVLEEDGMPERHHPMYRGKQEIQESRYLTDAFREEACSFLERNRSQPFFLYFAPNAVHGPLQATECYWNRFPGVTNPRRRMLAAMASGLDDAVGSVLERLRAYDLEQDTLVFFLSDNGSPLSKGAGSNGIFNGSKFTYYEGGVHVPFLARWPGKIPAGKVYSHPVVSRDIVPTALAAAGIPQPAGVRFDGLDLLPFLNGTKNYAPHDVLFWRAGKGRAVVMGRWKLVECGPEYIKLYDLSADPGETKDLSARYPEVFKELRQAWSEWNSKMIPPIFKPRKHKCVINGEELTWDI
jgi:arylsulfatase A-like enzyme